MLVALIHHILYKRIIFLYQIILDVIALMAGIYLVGFIGTPTYSIKLILEMGCPSVSHISNISMFANQPTILNELDAVHFYVVLIVIILIMLRAFFQGGYIQYLSSIMKEKKYSF